MHTEYVTTEYVHRRLRLRPVLALVLLVLSACGARSAAPAPVGGGRAAVAVDGIGELVDVGGDQVAPIGSVAKVMTAYLVLRDHPLADGDDGPVLVVTAADEADYRSRIASGQSLLEVRTGDRLTERQAVEALLVPSANNIADLLARWDSGSVDAFVARMNATAADLSMARTHYADPSGFDPATVSSPRDQVALAQEAMQIPALAQIAAMRSVQLPRVGAVANYNRMLGVDGVVGLKTGSTDQAGGNLLFAAWVPVDGRDRLMVGAVFGQLVGHSTDEQLDRTFAVSRSIIEQATALAERAA